MYAASILPIANVRIEKKWVGPRSYSQRRKVYEREWRIGEPEPPHTESIAEYKMLRNLTARVTYGEGMTFTVVALDSGAISFKSVGSENDHRADNIFAAWSMIRHMIEKGEPVEITAPKGVRGHGRQKYDWGQE